MHLSAIIVTTVKKKFMVGYEMMENLKDTAEKVQKR
jgi:uncharacterized membrane protein (DUF106 family)